MSVIWITTNQHVYHAIYREHYERLAVFASCTCPNGDSRLGHLRPYIMTAWGFEGADEPIIKSVARKKTFEQKEYDYEYFIAGYKEER